MAPLYDFEALGTGAFEFEPVTTFQVVEADAKPQAYKVSAKKLTVNVKQDVARRELKAAAHEKRARVSCSSSSEASFISSAYSEGKSLASIAANYVSSNGADSLFRSYFGSTSTSTVRGVLSVSISHPPKDPHGADSALQNVANENSSSRTLNCADPYGACTSGVIAYTVISTTNI